MKGFFNFIGLCSGICLTGFDGYTSFLGFRSLIPTVNNKWYALFLPIVMAGLTLAMNAGTSNMLFRIKSKEQRSGGTLLIAFCFVVCIGFDLLTSWLGFILVFGGGPDFTASMQSATEGVYIISIITAVIVTIGPMLTTLFHEQLKQDEGFFANLLKG